jgi:translation initiation factor 2 beta subunit (eIF-2beta)/eIF-5
MPLTREDLNAMPCAVCGHTHCDHERKALLAPCHPEAGTLVSYIPQSGTLFVQCRRCGEMVTAIAVATRRIMAKVH